MKNDLQCFIVEDLLILYVENLTSLETNALIEQHLNKCDNCKTIYNDLLIPIEPSNDEDIQTDVNYLKKYNLKSRKRVFASIISTIFIFAFMILIKLYIIGYEVDFTVSNIDLNENSIVVAGEINTRDSVYSYYKIEDNELIIYGKRTLKMINNQYFSVGLNKQDEDLKIGDYIYTSDNKLIDQIFVRLLENRNPYVGDISANMKLAELLKITNTLGPFESRLQTSEEPYEWKMIFDTYIHSTGMGDYFDGRMQNKAIVLLALIDNLEIVTWEYKIDNVIYEKSFTANDASSILERDVKEYGNYIEDLEKLFAEINYITSVN